ncbi:MAG: surface carbohydrate biosynthesis protein [Pseudomonadota bacterium]
MLCAIPMEITSRELDGVLYLALHLAKRGLPTLFGERMVHEYIFRIYDGRPVVYFDQDQNATVNQRVIDTGGLVVNLNAEGQNLDVYPQLLDMFAKVAPTFTAMFVRGDKQRESLVRAFPEDRKHCVIATGHPSFDMLDSRFNAYHESPDIVARHGRDFIQINTQFVSFNHKMGFDHYLKLLATLDEWKDLYTNEEFLATTQRQRDYEEKVALEFVGMAQQVAKAFPGRHVIVRPHPMEGREFYMRRLSGIDNLFIEPDGPVRPWLASSAALIHHSCTTGVEALLMGKHVIRFEPVGDAVEKNMQSNAGILAKTTDEIIALIDSAAMPQDERRAQLELMRPHMANIGGLLAAPIIADHVAKLAEGGRTWLPEKLGTWESAKCWRKYCSKVLRSRQPGRVGKKVRYALEKFPRLPFAEVQRLVDKLRAADPGLPAVELRHLGLNTFLMKPE